MISHAENYTNTVPFWYNKFETLTKGRLKL